MIGFLKLILDGMADDPAEKDEFIREAYASALHLLEIITDVLDIAKIEAGTLQIELNPVNLNELLDDVRRFANSQMHQKRLSFEIQKPPTDDEIILFGDYLRLKQVMFNLVGNAIKFTHEGGVTIGIEVIKKKTTFLTYDLPGMVKVRVADTGIGVSLDKQDRLFNRLAKLTVLVHASMVAPGWGWRFLRNWSKQWVAPSVFTAWVKAWDQPSHSQRYSTRNPS
jgi:signal transduction histidine kinase